MSILNKKYDGLKPQLSYLADEVILSQAWKKSQSYIRSHNWYADTLELDCSAANMENLIGIWKQELNSLEYFPNEMRLVPAPKSDEWTFSCLENGEWVWGPQQKEKSTGNNASVVTDKELRPLAHLTIRDQTVASSIMLCLADAIESEQGSTDPEHKHEVWSYGNRLFCDWEGKSAKFRWGNSSVYSKYFQDYQRFLERPIKKAQIEWPSLVSSESLYEVHLDIAAFYDSIDRERLIKVLKSISKNHYCSEINEDNDFWTIVNNTIFGWKWSRDDNILACCLKNSILPEKIGVPQGLVASGFFANAYLIELDNMVSKFIGQPYETITLIDYCRYVDDIRLLVKISGNDKDDIIQWLEKNIYPCVSLINGIVLNKEKFKIEKVFASKSETSSRMKVIQQAMSGPQDKNAIDDMLGSLDGLFSMAELFRGDKRSAYNNCDILLSHIDNPQMDVREDTLLRFAANRIALALDKKRLLVGDETNEENGLHELDRFCESMARRFIAVWSQNPSLVSVLKKGFSLYPHQKILKPVIDVLFKKIVNGNIKITTSVNEIRVAIYCISEIFKFAALELSPKKLQPWPFHSDVEGFLKLLLKYARSLISREIPWYLRQQIVLFLAVSGERLCSDRINIKDGEEDKYQLLQCILCGNHPFETDKILEDKMATFIIAHQISHDRDKIVGNLGIWLDKLKKNKHQPAVETILESISLNDPLMFRSLLEYGQQVASDWYQGASIICRRYGFDHQALSGKMEEFNGRDIPLAAVIKRPDNPFAHENGLLELANEALSLLEKKANFEKGTNSKGNSLSPQFLKITCSDWTKLQSADSDLRDKLITLTWVAGNRRDKRYKSPGWLADNEDSNSLYQLGCFLRACAIGDMDFTATKLLSSAGPWYTYFGINSSWYKRRIGMAHQPETLIGEAAPMSSWISELLYRLLQWPGLTLYSSKLSFVRRICG